MSRYSLLAGLAAALGAAAPAADGPPALPKDTLPARLSLDVPLGLPPRPVPQDSPLTEGRVRLGRRLFFDPILSADNTVSCAGCHHPDHGFAGDAARSRGLRGQKTARRAPSLLNRAFGRSFFWDGREASLEDQ